MDNKEIQFDYRVKAIQGENRISKITAVDVDAVVECATPPDFPNGIAGVWSPETFFLAAIAGCYVNTYQSLCDKFKMQPVSLECEASGTVALVDGKYAFTGVMLNPIVTLSNYEDEATALKIMEKAHRYCLISNSIKCPVSVSENVLVLVP
jgi:organic hydroperoxide reductase OsmC/OhrA